MKPERFSQIAAVLTLLSLPAIVVFWLFFSDRNGISPQDEREIGRLINEHFRQGDMIFSFPSWDIGYTSYLREGITDISLSFDQYDKASLSEILMTSSNKLIFILENQHDFAAIAESHDLKKDEEFQLEGASVVFARPNQKGPDKLLDFAASISQAQQVYLEDKNGKKSPCSLEGERWQCSHHDWNYVGMMRALLNGRWMRSLWAHPRSRKKLVVEYRLPPGSRKVVLGTAFLPRAYNSSGDSVDVVLSVDGKEVLKYKNLNIKKYYRKEVELGKQAQRLSISFYVRRDGGRHFVFNGFVTK